MNILEGRDNNNTRTLAGKRGAIEAAQPSAERAALWLLKRRESRKDKGVAIILDVRPGITDRARGDGRSAVSTTRQASVGSWRGDGGGPTTEEPRDGRPRPGLSGGCSPVFQESIFLRRRRYAQTIGNKVRWFRRAAKEGGSASIDRRGMPLPDRAEVNSVIARAAARVERVRRAAASQAALVCY